MIDDIAAGEHDDDLADIAAAVRDRANEIGRKFAWRITIDGDTWDEDTVTIGEVRHVERITGINWSDLAPLVSADVATQFIIAHWNQVDGMKLEKAWDKAQKLTAKDVIAAVSEYETAGKGQPAPGK
jgi:hypothetical protein